MATRKPYSYHTQLTLLIQALKALKKVEGLLGEAFTNELVQLGAEEAFAGGYGELTRLFDDFQSRVEDHADAVKALAVMQPPDPVEPRDPQDFSQDERFHQMIDHAFDVATGHGVEPQDVVKALEVAVSQGDQR